MLSILLVRPVPPFAGVAALCVALLGVASFLEFHRIDNVGEREASLLESLARHYPPLLVAAAAGALVYALPAVLSPLLLLGAVLAVVDMAADPRIPPDTVILYVLILAAAGAAFVGFLLRFLRRERSG